MHAERQSYIICFQRDTSVIVCKEVVKRGHLWVLVCIDRVLELGPQASSGFRVLARLTLTLAQSD